MSPQKSVVAEGIDADRQALADRLREARSYLGLSQGTVAEHLGITRPAVSAIERGTRKVSGLELKRLAEIYRRPVTYFLDAEADGEVILGADSFDGALFRATQALDEADRDQVLKFAEFLRQGPAAGRPSEA